MFREMRRGLQKLSETECIEILKNGSHGTLALLGDEGYPYAVPLSYVYTDGVIYFHGAKSGHKYDAIKNCDKASFCVVSQDDVVPEAYTTHYMSVIAFGKISIVEDESEFLSSAKILGRNYNREGTEKDINDEIEKYAKALCMIKLEIVHMTGKQSRELYEMRKNSSL